MREGFKAIAEWEAEHGPLTAAELEAARQRVEQPSARRPPQEEGQVKAVVYDASVLIAADRGERRLWAEHRARLEAGVVPLVPAPVVAHASRSPRQAQLRQLLRGCEVVSLDEDAAHRVGKLPAASGTSDIADGAVVALAVERKADVRTEDGADILRLVSASRAKARVVQRRDE